MSLRPNKHFRAVFSLFYRYIQYKLLPSGLNAALYRKHRYKNSLSLASTQALNANERRRSRQWRRRRSILRLLFEVSRFPIQAKFIL